MSTSTVPGCPTQTVSSTRSYVQNLANRGIREYWVENALTYTPSFQSLVANVIAGMDVSAVTEPGARS